MITQDTVGPIKRAYHLPTEHQQYHRVTVRLIPSASENNEVMLLCPECNTVWHTGKPDTGKLYTQWELIALAARYLYLDRAGCRPALQLPLLLHETDDLLCKVNTKRRYTRAAPVDTRAQIALPLAA